MDFPVSILDVRRASHGALLVLALLMATGLATCDGGNDPPGAQLAAASGTSVPAGSSGPRDPSHAHPLSVVAAGDSVMENLAGALVAALDGNEAVVSHVWLLSLTRDASSRVLIGNEVAEADPDIVVVLMGVWELEAIGDDLMAPGWQARYTSDVLEPFVTSVTRDGAEVLFVGMPALDDPVTTSKLDVMTRAYENLAADDDRVSFLDAGQYVDDPAGRFALALPGPDGAPVPVRNPDGLHICPAGVVRVLEPVLDQIESRWPVPLGTDWQRGSWALPGLGGPMSEGFVGCPPG